MFSILNAGGLRERAVFVSHTLRIIKAKGKSPEVVQKPTEKGVRTDSPETGTSSTLRTAGTFVNALARQLLCCDAKKAGGCYLFSITGLCRQLGSKAPRDKMVEATPQKESCHLKTATTEDQTLPKALQITEKSVDIFMFCLSLILTTHFHPKSHLSWNVPCADTYI